MCRLKNQGKATCSINKFTTVTSLSAGHVRLRSTFWGSDLASQFVLSKQRGKKCFSAVPEQNINWEITERCESSHP